MLDTVAVDVGSMCVRIGCWDGEHLMLEWLPGAIGPTTLSEIVFRFGPHEGFRFCIRDGRGVGNEFKDELIRQAFSTGAMSVRWFADRLNVDPTLAAAWGASRRHRFKQVAVCNWNDRGFSCTTHAASGRGLRHYEVRYRQLGNGTRDLELDSDHLTEFMSAGLHRGVLFDWVSVGHCDIGNTPTLAEMNGRDRVLVPDYAGMLGVVGMIAGPYVHEFHEPVKPRPLDSTWLSDRLIQLGEQSAHAVTIEGCDLDDAESTRIVHLGDEGRPPLAVECGAKIEIAELIERWEILRRRIGGPSRKRQPVLVHGMTVRTVVEQPFVTMPRPSEAIVQGEVPFIDGRIKLLKLKGKKTARAELAFGDVIGGPAVIVEPWHVTVVPAGWRAEVAMAGGILLRRVGA